MERTGRARYANLNAAIGMLRIWGTNKTPLLTPLFIDSDLLASGFLTPKVTKVLKRMPSDPGEWAGYLAGFGSGLLPPDKMEPGDFLLYRDERQGIALDSGEMLLWNGENLRITRAAGAKSAWRPSPRPTS